MFSLDMKAPIQKWEALGADLGIELWIQRDDLLPFPLAGNKVRKIYAELQGQSTLPDVLITNGSIDSNHCRTTAWMATLCGIHSHLVLHGDPYIRPEESRALRLLEDLGATYEVVIPSDIHDSILQRVDLSISSGENPYVIPGGCHSPLGAQAYRDAGLEVFGSIRPDVVYVASGTGATQGGLVAAAEAVTPSSRVIGISVARPQDRGVAPVMEAAQWAGAKTLEVEFLDRFIGEGYASSSPAIRAAVGYGWSFGLPLDYTYTGKAFAALIDDARNGLLYGKKVLFWHTGGLWNALQQ